MVRDARPRQRICALAVREARQKVRVLAAARLTAHIQAEAARQLRAMSADHTEPRCAPRHTVERRRRSPVILAHDFRIRVSARCGTSGERMLTLPAQFA